METWIFKWLSSEHLSACWSHILNMDNEWFSTDIIKEEISALLDMWIVPDWNCENNN